MGQRDQRAIGFQLFSCQDLIWPVAMQRDAGKTFWRCKAGARIDHTDIKASLLRHRGQMLADMTCTNNEQARLRQKTEMKHALFAVEIACV